jgi:ADP-L-glycero-D-manno-heptose 6-epimerase
MLVVTGGAGFIGSNLVKQLNRNNYKNILVVDDLTQGIKFKNVVTCDFEDYIDKDYFQVLLKDRSFQDKITAIFHQGACSVTTEWDGRYMMENNYDYSKKLLHASLEAKIPFIYASSASVYGLNSESLPLSQYEAPLNVYGYSKLQFDRYVRKVLPTCQSQVVGLRYFNVYGPGEQHKGPMASVIYHFNQQLITQGKVKLFKGYEGYEDGEQRRDFIHVDDVTRVNIWFLENPSVSGIFNVGTGLSRSFNDVAHEVINYHGSGSIEYIEFPDHLKGHYQSFTQADISELIECGYSLPFISLEEGVRRYLGQMVTARP